MENLNSNDQSKQQNFRNSLLLKDQDNSILKKTEQQYLNELDKLHSKEKFEKTEALARKFLKDYNNSPNGYNFLGLSQFGQKKNKEAIESFQKAFTLKNDGIFLNNLGLVHIENSEHNLALEIFIKASEFNSQNIQIKMNLASAYEKNNDLENAYILRKQIVDLDIYNVETLFKLYGMPNAKNIDIKNFIEKFKILQKKSPDDLKIIETLITLLKKNNLFQDALPLAYKALEIDPSNDQRHSDLALILTKLNQVPIAKNHVAKAIKINPQDGKHWLTLGWIEHQYGKMYHAIECYKKAILYLDDKHKGWPLNNIGNAYIRTGEIELARKSYLDAQKYTSEYEIIQNYMCNLSYMSEDLKTIFDEHRRYTKEFDDITKYTFLEHQKKKVNNKIRIGYVSPNFKMHSVSYFFNQLLAHHDKDEFEIILYSNLVGPPDDITNHLRSNASMWRDIRSLNDKEIISLIQKDNINILVDLIGNFAGGKSTVFAFKPAPIQVSYLGYVTTTGLKSMDYRFTTLEADPNKDEDKYYSEKLIRLPNTFLCYTGTNVYSANNPPCVYGDNFTFGSFNNLSKITLKTIRIWSLLLKNVKNSRLLLKSSSATDRLVHEQLMSKFENNGIERSRITCLTKADTNEDHLKLYNLIDIALDTFPFNGATTTLEALWMGVPVMTITGATHHGRVSTSILKVLKMDNFIANNEKDFVKKTIKAYENKEELISLRKNLRKKIKHSYLCQGKLFAQNIEKEYFKMFEKLR